MKSELTDGISNALGDLQSKFNKSFLASEPLIGAQLLDGALTLSDTFHSAGTKVMDVAYTHANQAVTAIMRDGVSVDFGKHSVSAHVAEGFFQDFFRTGIEQDRIVIMRKDGLPEQDGIANVRVLVDGAMYCFVREIGFYHPDRPDNAVSSEVLLTFGPAFSQETEQLLQSKTPDGIRRAAEFLKRVSYIQEGIKAAGEIYLARQDKRHFLLLSLREEMRLVSEALGSNPYTGSPRPIEDITKGENDSGMPYDMCLTDAKDVLEFVAGGKTKELLILRLADSRFRQQKALEADDVGRYQEAIEVIKKDIHDRYKEDKL